MFNKDWFLKHQETLLTALNTPLVGDRFRDVLRVDSDRSSVGDRRIVGILPNTVFWQEGNQFVAEFRTHDKFSKRLYYSFLPLWKLLHAWDTLFANVFQPAWNLGFDSLTQYPDVGTGATTCDANLQYTTGASSTWATAHDATAATSIGTGATLESIIDAQEVAGATDQFQIVRGGFGFDLSSISGATISAVTMSYWPTAKVSSAAGNANIYSFTPATNNTFVAEDYDQFGTTAYSDNALVSGVTTGQYLGFAFNATGLAGTTAGAVNNFGAREATFDVANSATAANTRCNLDGYYADQTGTTNDPKLVVTYTPAPAFLGMPIMFP